VDGVLRSPRLIRFQSYEADLDAGELRKNGRKLKLSGQPFQVLAILLERPGEVVTREELQKRLWPDTFVDVEHNLNTAINKIRDVLGDSAENPRFVDTLPRRGYRFAYPIDKPLSENGSPELPRSAPGPPKTRSGTQQRLLKYGVIVLSTAIVVSAGMFLLTQVHAPHPSQQHPLSRITFDAGLQLGPTWSPDGRLLAYASDRGGKLDIWVQQVSGGEPVRVTHTRGNNWQPSWSPDGKYIAYRSEAEAGLFIIPALGSEGPGRRIASFGYRPQWSPDGSQIVFQTLTGLSTPRDTFYIVGVDGSQPKVILDEFLAQHPGSIAWHPDGKQIAVWEKRWDLARSSPNLWTVPLLGGTATRWEIAPNIAREFEVVSGGKQTCDVGDSFSWAPSGKAVYFACEYRGATNIWKMTVDPETIRATGVERLTTGPGPDEEPKISPDGGRIAFSAKSARVRIWLLPFDSSTGRIRGKGSAVTSVGSQAYTPNLSPDGKKLEFSVLRGGRWEIWEKPLPDGQETPLISGDYDLEFPQWSRDGKRLVYRRIRARSGTQEWQFGLWSEEARTEKPLTGLHTLALPMIGGSTANLY
jgi:Tol biopolymer transport system component/DNA-binding winged helix-turn-helix (wHTH) protein